MTYISLHQIVNSILLQKNFPVHLYGMYLKYAADGLRELHFDSLKVVNMITFEGELCYDLPCDYMDVVRIGVYHNYCDDYSPSVDNCDCYGNRTADGMYWRYGHWFGMWHRETIDISEGKLTTKSKSKIIFEYISDGSAVDNATRITPYAQDAIEKYCEWKYKRFHRSYGEREVLLAKEEYSQAHNRLRSRLSDLTIYDIKFVIRKGANTPIKL